MGEKRQFYISDLLMIIVGTIWGVNYVFIKIALREMPPFMFNVLRFIGSSLFFIIFYRFYIKDFTFIKKYLLQLLFLGIIGHTIMQVLFIKGVSLTSASNASLMFATTPLYVGLLCILLKQQRVTIWTWVGILLSLIGVMLIVKSTGNGLEFSKKHLWGDVCVLCSSLCWSVFTVFVRPFVKNGSVMAVVAITIIFGTVFLIPVGIPDMLKTNWLELSLTSWSMVIISFVFANIFGYIVWFYSLQKVGSVHTAIYQNLVPICGVISASLFLGEQLTMNIVIGGICIIAGITVTRLSSGIKKEPYSENI